MQTRETERLSSLSSFAIMQTPPEPEFDRLARLARHVAQADIAHISFHDSDNQFIKAIDGAQIPSLLPRPETICDEIVRTGLTLTVEDLAQDERPCCVAHGRTLGMTSYAGVPVRDPKGHVLGAIATFSTDSKVLSARRLSALDDLAQITVRELMIRRATTYGPAQKLDTTGPANLLRHVTRNHLHVLRAIRDGVIGVNRDGSVNFVNPAAESILARPASSMLGLAFSKAVRTSSARSGVTSDLCQVSASLRDGQERIVRSDLFCTGEGSLVPVEYVSSPLVIHSEVVGSIIVFRSLNATSVSNGIELRHALREVKRLKEQLVKIEAGSHDAILPPQPTHKTLASRDEQFGDVMTRMQEVEAAQIMRMMALTGNVVDGPDGAAALLDIAPALLRLKLQGLKDRPPARPVSRLDRWLA